MSINKSILFLCLALLCSQCKVPDPYGDLYILVRDESGNLVSNCEVTIYLSEEDFLNETDKEQGPNLTDENGRAFFLDLEKGDYYIAANKVDNNIEKNNLLVATNIEILVSEIGYRNSATVIIWDSFVGNMSSSTGKIWEYSNIIDQTTGEEKPIPDCLKDDQLVFYRNGNFQNISQSVNCTEGVDDNFEGTYAPVSNGSYVEIKDKEGIVKNNLYVISVTDTDMITQSEGNFIYYKANKGDN